MKLLNTEQQRQVAAAIAAVEKNTDADGSYDDQHGDRTTTTSGSSSQSKPHP